MGFPIPAPKEFNTAIFIASLTTQEKGVRLDTGLPFLFMKSLIEVAQQYRDGPRAVRELPGQHNRSPWIDDANRLVGNRLGDPYCVAGILKCQRELIGDDHRMTDLIRAGRALPITGSSQYIRHWAESQGRLTRNPQRLSEMTGALGGWTNPGGRRGHLFLIERRMTSGKGLVVQIGTTEFNTSSAGERNGEGCFGLLRNVPTDRGHTLWFVDMTGMVGGGWWT